jgi:UDP-glucose 4-epimerase
LKRHLSWTPWERPAPFLPLPPALLAALLGAAQRLGLSARGAEQVDFLRHRPVLSNEKLVREFGFAPLASEVCFERYRRARFGPGI